MYNFRYHLITICSIFIALAVGLLLGAAITGSDLVQDTSNDMVDSLLQRFDETEGQNATLREQVVSEQQFSSAMFNGWKAGRLTGRNVVVLSDRQSNDSGLADSVADTISGTGGNTVRVTMLQADMGIDDEALRLRLQELLPEVEGTPYSSTLAEALLNEWTTSYTSLVALQPPPAADGQAGTETGTEADAGADADAQPPAPQYSTSSTGIAPTSDVEQAIFDRYPLTIRLLEMGCLQIDSDYQANIAAAQDAGSALQLQLWTLLEGWNLPYAANGIVAIAANGTDGNGDPSPMAVELAQLFRQKGNSGNMPYPAMYSNVASTHTPLGENATVSYFALLCQDGPTANSFAVTAQEHALPCVTTPRSQRGQYALIALLSGAERGVYGEDRTSEFQYPSLPDDQTGRTPFIG